MTNLKKNLGKILNRKEKKKFLIVLVGTFIVGLLESISIGSLVGYLMIISEPDTIISAINNPFLKNYLSKISYFNLIILSSIFLITLFFFKNLIQIFFHYLEINFIKKLQVKFTKNIFNIFLNKPYIYHINQNSSSSINTILNETKRASDYINNLLMITRELIILGFLLIIMIIVNYKLSIMLTAMMVLSSVLFYIFIKKKIKTLGFELRIKSEKILKNLTESILSIKIIKLLNKNNFFINILSTEMKEKKNIEVTHSLIGRVPKFFLEILSVITIILILIFFVNQGKTVQEALPILSLIVLIIIRTMPAYVSINTNLNNIKYNSVSFKNICSTLLNDQDVIIKKNINFDFNQKLKIVISNLTFSYKEKLVFDNISCEFSSGKIYGVKGVSGSGKTTFLNLILGLLTPSKGQIFFNNELIDPNVNFPDNFFSYVPQEIYLLDNSVVQNIAIGVLEEDIDYNKVNQIISKFELKDFIDTLEHGLKTEVGDKGIKISGGQRQRIGLARALYFEPKVIILDEATNAMDKYLEEKIISNLNNLKEDKIIILVSHNQNILEKCDEKIEIKNSKIFKY